MFPYRVTPNISVSQFLQQLSGHSQRLVGLQQQATTGLKWQRPSDNPTAVRHLLGQEEAIRKLETRQEALASATSVLEQAHVGVREALNLFVKAGTLATAAIAATDPSEQAALASEVDSLLTRLDGVANLRLGDGYLFAGVANDRQPFVRGPDGSVYQGADIPVRLEQQSGTPLTLLATGEDIFQPKSRQPTLFLGSTGAAGGSGTDTGIESATLVVRHDTTTFAAGSGLAAGVDSPAGDTIIGPPGEHRVTINDTSGTGAFGTISLNDGPPVPFSSGDDNLPVTGPNGELIFVDTTTITAGFVGSVDVTATGTLSTDGGLTEVSLDFSANQTVVDSRTGAITHVNSTAIRRSGHEPLEYPGTTDAFATLRALRDEIKNISHLPEGERQAALGRRAGEVQRLQAHLLDVVGDQSVTLAHLGALETQTEDILLELRRQVSENAAADITQVALQLQQTQSQLQYTLATASRLFDVSLLEFLR